MQATDKKTVKRADALTDWMFQDSVGVYKNSSKWACVARYFVNPAFRIVVQFRFFAMDAASSEMPHIDEMVAV